GVVMPTKHILLVEKEPQNRRLLEVSLSKAGFEVDVATSMSEALAITDVHAPNVIISGTELDGPSGFDLCKAVRERGSLNNIPFLFLSEDTSIDAKVRGIELGADDYLIRPIYIKDLIARIETLITQRNRATDAETNTMRGELESISVVELIQSMSRDSKDGTARIDGEDSRGSIWFRSGQIIDATVDNLQGEAALFRMIRWDKGHFEIEFQTPERIVAIRRSVEELIHEALNQTELWNQLCQQLPALSTICQVNFDELSNQLGQMPDTHTALIRHIDGEKSILDVVNSSNLSDVEALNIFNQLFFEGVVNGSAATPVRAEGESVDLQLGDLGDAFVNAIENKVSQSTVANHDVTEAPPIKEPEELMPPVANLITASAVYEEEPDIDDDDIHEYKSSDTSSIETPSVTTPSASQSFWDLNESTKDVEASNSEFDSHFKQQGDEPSSFPSMQGETLTDAIDEADFFDAPTEAQSYEDEGFMFDDEDVAPAPGGGRKVAIILLLCLVPAVIYIFARDRIKPLEFDKRDLNEKWAESAVNGLPPTGKTVALDAGWNIPSLNDGGLLPPAPGSDDTFQQSRSVRNTEVAPVQSSEQAAMKPVDTSKDEAKSIEAGNTATPEQKKEAAELIEKSVKEIDAEAFKSAATLLEKSLALDPSNIKALRLNALVHVELNKMEDGIEFALKAIRLGATIEDTTELYQLLGQAYQSLGQVKEARTAYENFLTVAPKSKNPQTKQAMQFIRQLLGSLNEGN
ncbi:MAG: response regulator, partial [Bradymonadia bacterium]